MESLARAGWRTLTLPQFADALHSTKPLARTFLLTFDDGYAGLATHAYPILADLGFAATTFLITDHIGKTNTWDARYTWNRLPHLDWQAIEEWRGRGFDFGSHGATHRRLTWLDGPTIQDELRSSRHALVERLGERAGIAVAYPFGAANGRVTTCAQVYGYHLGFGGPRGDLEDRYNLPREPVYMWDRWALPFGLRHDALGAVGRRVAKVANAAALGTTLFKALMPARRNGED
jgi:peptidoglycan/xylan/chitin deacetylase (PgdA/CDA1 family)